MYSTARRILFVVGSCNIIFLMLNNMQIYGRPTSPSGADESMSFPEDFPASRSVSPDNDEVRMTIVTSGRRCCAQFGKSVHAGSFAKMFSDLLVGRKEWFSNKCVLTWKLKVTKFNRTYFQLAVSIYRTWFVAHAIENPDDSRCLCRPIGQERTTARQFGVLGSRGSDRIHLPAGTDADRSDARSENISERSFGTFAEETPAGTPSERLSEGNAELCGNNPHTTVQRCDGIPSWDDFPTQSPVCRGDDGISDLLDHSAVFEGLSEDRRRRKTPFVRWRTEAIKCYGNAIVPQVAYRIFQTIVAFENISTHSNQ